MNSFVRHLRRFHLDHVMLNEVKDVLIEKPDSDLDCSAGKRSRACLGRLGEPFLHFFLEGE